MSADLVVLAAALLLVLDGVHVVHHHRAVGLARAAANRIENGAPKSSIRRFVITEKAPTRAFSWLKAATTAFTFKTLC